MQELASSTKAVYTHLSYLANCHKQKSLNARVIEDFKIR